MCVVLMSFVLLAAAPLRAQQVAPPENITSEAWAAYVAETQAALHALAHHPSHADQAPQPAPAPHVRHPDVDRPTLQSFSVVLLEGDVQGTTTDDVPAAVRAALADMKDFLPFKSYRLFDVGLIRAPIVGEEAVMKLRAPDLAVPQTIVSLKVIDTAPKLGVRFRLESASHVIDTTLSMDVGETVVVGTSRNRANKALIAVLTAVAKK
jgi:hypothetical protein